MCFKVKDKFSPPRSDHQIDFESIPKCLHSGAVKEEVVQKEHLSETLEPILNNLSFVNKMKFNILYWNDQTYVSFVIRYGREKHFCGFQSLNWTSYQLFETIRSFLFGWYQHWMYLPTLAYRCIKNFSIILEIQIVKITHCKKIARISWIHLYDRPHRPQSCPCQEISDKSLLFYGVERTYIINILNHSERLCPYQRAFCKKLVYFLFLYPCYSKKQTWHHC